MGSRFFDIHPHSGYLNTEFTISNLTGNTVLIFDKISGRPSLLTTLSPNETKTSKLSAGEHSICAVEGFSKSRLSSDSKFEYRNKRSAISIVKEQMATIKLYDGYFTCGKIIGRISKKAAALMTDKTIADDDCLGRLLYVEVKRAGIPDTYIGKTGKIHSNWIPCIIAVSINDVPHTDIKVEDAIKLGGGRQTNAYASEKSPWVLVKMTDRLYFHNVETGKEFVEMNIAPDDIDYFGSKLGIFHTKGEGYSIFSFESCSYIDQSKSKPYFKNDYCAVFIESVEEDDNFISIIATSGHIIIYSAQKYAINSETNELYIYANGTIKNLSLIDQKFISEVTPIVPFITFIESGFYVGSYEQYSRLSYNIYDIKDGKNDIIGTIENAYDIVKVVDADITPTEVISNIKEERSQLNSQISSYAKSFITVNLSYREINAFYKTSNAMYFIEKVILNNVESRFVCRVGAGLRVKLPANYKIIVSDDTLIVQEGNKTLIILEDDSYHLVDARLVETNCGYALQKELGGGRIQLSTIAGNLLTEGPIITELSVSHQEKSDTLLKYGWVSYKKPDGARTWKPVYNANEDYPEFKHAYICSNSLLLNDDNHSYVLLKEDVLRCIDDIGNEQNDILAISENAQYIVTGQTDKCGNILRFNLYDWDKQTASYSKASIFTNIYDSSIYRNVLFSGDGEHIVYSDADGHFKCRNLNDGTIINFHNEKYIKHNNNGYRSMIVFIGNGAAIPRVINPVSGQFLDVAELAEYQFASPDMNFTVKKPWVKDSDNPAEDGVGFVEYINRRTNMPITNQEYRDIVSNISGLKSSRQELLQKRIELMKTEPAFFAKAINRSISLTPQWASIEILSEDIIGYGKVQLQKTKKELIENYVGSSSVKDLINVKFKTKEYIIITNHNTNTQIRVDLGTPLWFLNYISFSFDSRYMAIAGRYHYDTVDERGCSIEGLFYLFDLIECKTVAYRTNTNAVWVTSFTKNGTIAYYDSKPNTYLQSNSDINPIAIADRSFLTFSPSGKYFALSEQGYVAIESADPRPWGHQPSTNVFIHKVSSPKMEIVRYNDHGSPISNTGSKTVSMAAFSADDKKLLSVSDDGVVVIRNLHLDEN